MPEDQPVMEKVASEVGNGAHVHVPKEWVGDVVRIQRIAAARPPLFQDVEEGDGVRVEYLGDGGAEESIEGTVQKSTLDLKGDTAEFTVSLDCEGNDWELVATRPQNASQWDEEYRVKQRNKEVYKNGDPVELTDDDPKSNDYATLSLGEDDFLTGHVTWETVGVIKSFAVKREVSL